jgi:hypothetical protein
MYFPYARFETPMPFLKKKMAMSKKKIIKRCKWSETWRKVKIFFNFFPMYFPYARFETPMPFFEKMAMSKKKN